MRTSDFRRFHLVGLGVLLAFGVALAALAFGGGGSPVVHEERAAAGIHGGRTTLYNGIGQLIADSRLVVVGNVDSQSVVDANGNEPPYTLSTVSVSRSVAPQGLAARSGGGVVGMGEGGTVVVRQMGVSGMEVPAPLLEVGQQYLLFLTPTGASGDTAGQYWTVGGPAGSFRLDGSGFARMSEDGDRLPAAISRALVDQWDRE
jgi:hypothetical protein